MGQIVIVSLFNYKSIHHKWSAFVRMGKPPLMQHKVGGLTFWKAMGVGSGAHQFGVLPDWGKYVLLTVFDSETNAQKFLQSDIYAEYTYTSHDYRQVWMKCIRSHGLWNHHQPFMANTDLQIHSGKIAVITRATIKPHHMFNFWTSTPKVVRHLVNARGLDIAWGIGEYPWLMQATFSIWSNLDAMKSFAYTHHVHNQMIKKTHQIHWYKEDLFARFLVIKDYNVTQQHSMQ